MATEKNFELISWWTGLSVAEKERVSGKSYPACSAWWNTLTVDAQQSLMANYSTMRTPGSRSRW